MRRVEENERTIRKCKYRKWGLVPYKILQSLWLPLHINMHEPYAHCHIVTLQKDICSKGEATLFRGGVQIAHLWADLVLSLSLEASLSLWLSLPRSLLSLCPASRESSWAGLSAQRIRRIKSCSSQCLPLLDTHNRSTELCCMQHRWNIYAISPQRLSQTYKFVK